MKKLLFILMLLSLSFISCSTGNEPIIETPTTETKSDDGKNNTDSNGGGGGTTQTPPPSTNPPPATDGGDGGEEQTPPSNNPPTDNGNPPSNEGGNDNPNTDNGSGGTEQTPSTENDNGGENGSGDDNPNTDNDNPSSDNGSDNGGGNSNEQTPTVTTNPQLDFNVPNTYVRLQDYIQTNYDGFYVNNVTATKHANWNLNRALNISMNLGTSTQSYRFNNVVIDNVLYHGKWNQLSSGYSLSYSTMNEDNISSNDVVVGARVLNGKFIIHVNNCNNTNKNDYRVYLDTKNELIIVRTPNYTSIESNTDSVSSTFLEFTKISNTQFVQKVVANESFQYTPYNLNGTYYQKLCFNHPDYANMSQPFEIKTIRIVPSNLSVTCVNSDTFEFKPTNNMFYSQNSWHGVRLNNINYETNQTLDFDMRVLYYQNYGNPYIYLKLTEGNYRVFYNTNRQELVIKCY